MLVIFAVFSGVYFMVPPIATVLFPRLRGEIYPLSMWSMFYRVHNRVDDFGLRVLSVGGKERSGRPYFEAAHFKRSKSIAAYHAIQKLGREIVANDDRRIERTRRTVEEAYLPESTVEYEIVRRSWDPYQRFQLHTFLKERTLIRLRSRDRREKNSDARKKSGAKP